MTDHHGPEYVRAQAKTAAAALIKKAAAVMEGDLTNPLFKKLFRHGPFHSGKNMLIVRFEYPGVLKVIDPNTGEVLAMSAPGRPGELCATFQRPALGAWRCRKMTDHHGPEYVRAQAKTAAAALIKKAAAVMEGDLTNPLFKKLFRYGPFHSGKNMLIARFEYPGVLKVIDPNTGEVLAVSALGRPGELCATFQPPTPEPVQPFIL